MEIQELHAVAAASDMERSEAFYTALVGRAPDDRPMDGLIQWRGIGTGGLQVALDATKAGHSQITIVTPKMSVARQDLADAGLALGDDIQGDFGVLAQIDDPDGNRLTLAEPPKGIGARAMELIITQNITLDGVIEQNDQTGEWFSVADEGDTSDVQDAMQKMMRQEEAQLYGRKTFEAMRGYWPQQTDDTTGVTDHLNEVDKYVLSATMDDPGWESSTVLHGDLHDEVRELKDRPGGNLGVTGSISVCHGLIEAGLVDEYRLLVYPVVVGRGRRLFAAGDTDGNLGLTMRSTTQFRSGVVLLTYRPV